MGLKAIFFDYGHTIIVPPERSKFAEYIRESLKELGIEKKLPEDAVEAALGKYSFAEFIEERREEVFTKILKDVIKDVTPELVRKLHADFVEIALRKIQLPEALLESLKKLKDAGMKLALLSNVRRRYLALELDTLGLSKFFDIIVTPDDVGGKRKSSMQPYKYAMRALGLVPKEVLMVGDDPDEDIRPANELNITSVLLSAPSKFSSMNTQRLAISGADFVIKDIIELRYLLSNLNHVQS